MNDLCMWPHVDFDEPPCINCAEDGSVYCAIHIPLIIRLIPERRLDDGAEFLLRSKILKFTIGKVGRDMKENE